eukprot:8924648-Prorocentrum_lima.AAC.1
MRGNAASPEEGRSESALPTRRRVTRCGRHERRRTRPRPRAQTEDERGQAATAGWRRLQWLWVGP